MKVYKSRDVKTPERGIPESAGLDFFVPEVFPPTTLDPGESINIASGIHVRLPIGYALIAFNKSGVALRGLQVGACVIDEDYQGEIHLHVTNVSDHLAIIKPSQKLVQFLCIRVKYIPVEVYASKADLYGNQQSVRGAGNFGSTG